MARHDEKPEVGDLREAEVQRLLARLSVPYEQHVQALLKEVKGKVVARTSAGRSGYCLEFNDGSWVICHLSNAVLEWRTGTGQPAATGRALMDALNVGNGRGPIPIDRPYANEVCDLEVEVACSVGKSISGVAVGETCFNLCFPDGHELDAMVLSDAQGKPALRVFWEQW